jgi:uncharacterized membrane protein
MGRRDCEFHDAAAGQALKASPTMSESLAAAETTEEKVTGRTEAFSDGVFAIAITLLILNLRAPLLPADVTPDAQQAALIQRLGAMWPDYVAYVMSFAVILVMWENHHRIFSVVRLIDQAFLVWNGLLLMLVCVVPFPTEILAKYFLTPSAKVAAAVYAGHGFLIAVAFTALWRHATRHARLVAPGKQAEVDKLTAQYRFGPLMYLVTLGLAFFSAWISIGLCLLFAVYFSLQGFTQKG